MADPIDPDAPTPKNPSSPPPPHPLAGGGYTYGNAQSVTPPTNLIDVDWNSVKGAMEGIAATNQKIVEQWGTINNSIREYEETLARANSTSAAHAHLTSVSAREAKKQSDVLDDLYGSQQDLERLRNETAQERARSIYAEHIDARNAMRRYSRMDPNAKYGELVNRGVVTTNETGQEGVRLGNQFIAADQIRDMIGNPDQQNEPILTYLNTQLKARIAEEVGRKAPSVSARILDAVEDAGIRQLRFGQLQVQDILRSASTLSGRMAERIQEGVDYQSNLAAYNARRAAAAAAGEAFTEEEPTAPTGGLARYGAKRTGAGGLGRVPGLGTLSMMAERLPEIGQMIALGQTLTRAVSGLYGQAFNAYAAPERLGQQTGQGFRAGVGARFDALRLGANPFDLFSGAMAQQTINSVRMMGFTGVGGGPKTMDIAEGIRDVVNNTGLSVDDAANFFEDALRRGGMSVDDVRVELDKFHDQARNLNMNITDYTKEILSNTQSLRTQGAAGAAPGIASALTAAVPRAYQGVGQQALQQMFTANRGAIVGQLNAQGVPANIITVSGPTYAARGYGALDQLILRDAMMARNQLRGQLGREATTDELANYMSQVGVYTRGQDPGFLRQYLNRMQRGQGVSQQISIQNAAARYTAELNTRTPLKREKISSLSDAELAAHGIRKHQVMGSRGIGVRDFYFDQAGNSLDANQEVKLQRHDYENLNNIPLGELARLRQHTLDQLAPGTLTRDERKIFESHLRDRKFQFAQELTQVRYDHRTGPTNRLDLPLISIELKGTANQLFALRQERQKAVGSGSIPANTLPSKLFPNTGSSDVHP